MTATSKHTPPFGPWFNTTEDDSPFGEVMDQPLDSGVTLHISVSGERAKEAARLIAAAPDLLQAVKDCEDAIDWCAHECGHLAAAALAIRLREVITKATGSPS